MEGTPAFNRVFDYSEAPTIKRFNKSDKFFRMLMGPFGSGKTSGCVAEIIDKGITQKPNQQGLRRTRWAVVRNTYVQLKDTTIKTFFEWLPPDYFGTYNVTDHKYLINKIGQLEDGSTPEIEIIFRALDKPEHIRNLLSLELTGAYFNEAREIPWVIIEAMEGRVRRYPSMMDGGFTWSGIIADTNPPPTDHWIYKLFEEKVYADPQIATRYELFRQPSGRSKKAENIRNLAPGYYTELAIGKDPDYIKVYIDGDYGYLKDGKPVFGNYNDTLHCSETTLEAVKAYPLLLGFDFGLTPACVVAQYDHKGRFNILKEFYDDDMGLTNFMKNIVKPYMFSKYQGFQIMVTGDPAGATRSDTDERTCFQILKANGFPPVPAPSNALMARYNSVDMLLTKLIEGKPAFQLSGPDCPILRKGFQGEYKLKKKARFGDDIYADIPFKNEYSHLQDALQYVCLLIDSGMKPTRYTLGSESVMRRSVVTSGPRRSLEAWV